MDEIFTSGDDLGPLKIIHVQEPSIGLKATLVVDNVAIGPSIGGVRMAPDVSTSECARLARAMTLKNAAAGIAHGGGKSIIYGNPKMDITQKEKLIRGMACALREVDQYIFGPDMGTDERCMAWVHDEIGRCVGLPREIGGIPLDEIGATGWGLTHSAVVAAKYIDLELSGATLVVQGFGSVGKNAARFLGEKGVILIGASDSSGTLYDSDGIDVEQLIELKENGKNVIEYPKGEKLSGDQIIDLECDIWVPAARPDVITEENMHRLKTKLVVEGANIPLTSGAEEYLYRNGTLCIPDFIANAGGVICGAMEFKGATQRKALEIIEERLLANTERMLVLAKKEQIDPRKAAVMIAMERLHKAMELKRWSLF